MVCKAPVRFISRIFFTSVRENVFCYTCLCCKMSCCYVAYGFGIIGKSLCCESSYHISDPAKNCAVKDTKLMYLFSCILMFNLINRHNRETQQVGWLFFLKIQQKYSSISFKVARKPQLIPSSGLAMENARERQILGRRNSVIFLFWVEEGNQTF